MKKRNNIAVNPIEGICKDNFNLVTMGKGKDTFSIVTCKFGNILTPFFDRIIKVVPEDRNSCFVVGEEKGKKSLHHLNCDSVTSYSEEITTPDELISIDRADKNTLIIYTTMGSYFMDSNTCKQLSDIYDRLYYDNKSKTWIYEKEITDDEDKTTLSGQINTYGAIGHLAYDTTMNIVRNIDFIIENGCPKIVPDQIIEDLQNRRQNENIRKLRRVRKIIKDNKQE